MSEQASLAVDFSKKIDRQEKSLQRMLDWNKAIDTKTQIILGLNIAVLGGLVAVCPKPNDLTMTVLGILAIGGILPVLSCIQCIRAFFPQTKGPDNSLLFFGAIDKITLEIFRKTLKEQTDEMYATDLEEQIYRNAQIATSKHKHVKSAIFLQAMGIIPWLGACYWLYKVV